MPSFILQGGHYEWHISNSGNAYGKAHILGGSLTDGLYADVTIGNTIARQLNLRLWNVELDVTQPLYLYVDSVAADGSRVTHNKGVYYIDTVSTSPYSEYSEITAFDSMLKAEVVYLKEGTWTSTTDTALVTEISTDIGVNIEADTAALFTSSSVIIDQAPSIGENGTTSRQILGVIAALRGGNFFINDAGELELARIADRNTVGGYVFTGFDGKTYEGTTIPDGASYYGIDESGLSIAIPKADITDDDVIIYLKNDGLFYSDIFSNVNYDPIQYETIEVGDEVATFDVSPKEVVSKIELQVNGNTYRSPQLSDAAWAALAGKCLTVSMPFMGSQAFADALYSKYLGFEYVPFTSEKTYVDPFAKLGTQLHIKNDYVFLSNRTLNIDTLASTNASANPTQEMQSSYPYQDPVTRSIRQSIQSNYTAIEIANSSISSVVQTFNEELGVNVAELTAHDPTDIYNASTNPNGYWRYNVVSSSISSWLTQSADGWVHIEGVYTGSPFSFPTITFAPVAMPSLNADALTLLLEIKDPSYTGSIRFRTDTTQRYSQYKGAFSENNLAAGKYYIPLNLNPSETDLRTLFTFGIDDISLNKGLTVDLRLSLYLGAYSGGYVPWSPNSYNSRVTQTADGILISLATKITEAEAQQLVDNYGRVVEQYLRFANGILELGESNSQFKALLTNTKLAFTGKDGQEVAWISNNQLFINEAIINGALSIRNNPSSTTMWRQYVDTNNIFNIKVVKPNA